MKLLRLIDFLKLILISSGVVVVFNGIKVAGIVFSKAGNIDQGDHRVFVDGVGKGGYYGAEVPMMKQKSRRY